MDEGTAPDGGHSPRPKAELHLHIEGTLQPEMVFELAARNDIRLRHDSPAELARAYQFTDLSSFLAIYYDNMSVLRRAQDFADLAEAYLRRAAGQGVVHAEIFFDPQAHTSRGVALAEVMAGLRAGLDGSLERFGITTGLIACFLRDEGADAAMACFRDLAGYRDQLLGVGLDSAEVGFPPELFRQVFDAARSEGLHLVAHAGEEGPPDYIFQALDVLGVERIDHGVRCLEDDRLVDRLRADRIPLTVCPSSNVKLGVFADWADVPVRTMLQRGLVVTLNSDDPAYFGAWVDDNYHQYARAVGLSEAELDQLAANSFHASFIDAGRRKQLLEGLQAPPGS
jgi:adenosine deaminase